MHDYESIYLVSEKLDTISAEEVDAAAAQIGAALPVGYREYVTQLGTGMFCSYLYVFPPQKVVEEVSTYQDVLREYSYLWSSVDLPIAEDEIGNLIVFAHTLDMDKITFHPGNPDQILMVPYTDGVISVVGSNLYEALSWLHRFGVSDVSDLMWFDSSANQGYVDMSGIYHDGLIREFTGLMDSLDLETKVETDPIETLYFCRGINGYFRFSRSDVRVFISCIFDKESRPVVDKIITFLKARDLSVLREGDRKK